MRGADYHPESTFSLGSPAIWGDSVGTGISAFLKRPRPLSVYLLALCASLTVPILIVAAFMTWRYAGSEEMRLKHSTEHTGEHIVHASEHQ